MESIFPKESVKLAQLRVNNFLQNNRFDSTYQAARIVMNTFAETSYGFHGQLSTGVFFPYPHESKDLEIYTDNCATIIPPLLLLSHFFGLKDLEVVELTKCNYIWTKKNEKDPNDMSHFVITANIGKERRYIIDPQMGVFGSITEEEDDYLKITGAKGYSTVRIEVEGKKSYSPKEFVELIEVMRRPEHSIEMLIEGQSSLGSAKANHLSGNVKVFYDDEDNVISTKLYLEEPRISNKAIWTHQSLNDEGEVLETKIELYLASDSGWRDLVDGKKVATVDLKTFRKTNKYMRKLHGDKVRTKRRISTLLDQDEHQEEREQMLSLVDRVRETMSEEEIKAIEKQVYIRTLYECLNSDQDLLYTEEKHSRFLKDIYDQGIKLEEVFMKTVRRLNKHRWKLKLLSDEERSKLNRKRKIVSEKYDKNRKERDELTELLRLHPSTYHRLTDMLIFDEKEIKERTTSQLRERVESLGYDPRIGHLAMICDFTQVLKPLKKHMTLDLYMKDISQKVRARRTWLKSLG